MSLVCSLSGLVPSVPVVSPSSGRVFERSTIVRHIAIHQTDPINNTPLKESDLIAIHPNSIQSAIRPRPPSSSSIPALLHELAVEYDATVLEIFQLKQTVATLRNELAHSLYQQEAGQRVIARLINERDEALAAVGHVAQRADKGENENNQQNNSQTSATAPSAPATSPPSTASVASVESKGVPSSLEGISSRVDSIIGRTADALKKDRKKLVKGRAEKAATVASLCSYQLMASHPLHHVSSASGVQGIAAMEGHSLFDELIVTGGMDGSIVSMNHKTAEKLATISYHREPIVSVCYHGSKRDLLSAALDGKAAYFVENPSTHQYSLAHSFAHHTDRITGATIHASGLLAATCSVDGSWNLYDLTIGTLLKSYTIADGTQPLDSGLFHVDGTIYGAAARDGVVKLFDVRAGSVVGALEGHARGQRIEAMAFAENGVNVATGDTAGIVKLWDLRKVKATGQYELQSFQLGDASAASMDDGPSGGQARQAHAVRSVSFDNSASYLVAAHGSSAYIVDMKGLSVVRQLAAHDGALCRGARWGAEAKYLATAGSDAQLKIWQ